MKKLILLAIIAMAALTVNAIPARPGKLTLKTANGGTIEARLVGDEFHHSFVSSDGYIVKTKTDGLYEKSTERFDAEQFARVRQSRMPARTSQPKSVQTNYATRGLVILVSFSDKAFQKTNTEFTNLLNQPGFSEGGSTGSAKDFFAAQSYGHYDPVFDVYGPYTLSHNMSYYGGNNAYNQDSLPDQMVVDAVAKLVQAEGNNILQQYDCDNDGYVDNVFIYYAGYPESSGAPSNTIWPHRSKVSPYYVDGTVTYGGKTIYDYACSSELDGSSGSIRTGIGAFCHEFSHVLGLPDLYDTEYSNQAFTPGTWDLMDQGCYNNSERTPSSYSSQERFSVGWLTPTLINQYGTYQLHNLNDSVGEAYLITSSGQHNLDRFAPYPAKYYLLEFRLNQGWDMYLPGHGMLIWKINYQASRWNNNNVNNGASPCCVIIPAKAKSASGRASGTDTYPGTRNVTSYKPVPAYSVEDITESSVISFTLADATGVEDVFNPETAVMIFRINGGRYVVSNLPVGATLRCYDAMGRTMWQTTAESESFEFQNEDGFFFLHIEGEGVNTTLRGI